MKKEEFKAILHDTYCILQMLTNTKGEEYSRDDDQLANFKRQGAEVNLSPMIIWQIFFNKHIDAIKSYIVHGDTLSEPIVGRIDDAILYLVLLKALIKDLNSTHPVPTQEENMMHIHRLHSGYWFIQGSGPCEWAQPPHWPCDEKTLREHAFPQASEHFIEKCMKMSNKEITNESR